MAARWRAAGSGVLLALAVMNPAVSVAEALPSPLTLEHALALADAAHPDVDLAQANLDSARAGLLRAESFSGVYSWLDLTPQSVRPTTDSSFTGDSRARLLAQKRLYDFGRSRSLEESARSSVSARELTLLDARQQRRIEAMARFFDVLLADMRYAVDNEALAYTYVAFDRGRDRQQIGQLSDVDLLELESRYQEMLVTRTASQKRQSSARLRLAMTLNRPEELPAQLVRPALTAGEREIPDYRSLFEQVRSRNPQLQALRSDAQAARAALDSERARRRPVLSAEAEAAWYEREFVSRDEVRATLNLRIPLYQGGEDGAAIAGALARWHEQQARLARAELDMRQTVLDLVQELETLKVELAAARVKVNYRDLYLDRSRALYEMEVRTDLGDAMTRITEAQWLVAQAEFRMALAWARLDALGGNLIDARTQENRK
jgi:outer membrane protein TolC